MCVVYREFVCRADPIRIGMRVMLSYVIAV